MYYLYRLKELGLSGLKTVVIKRLHSKLFKFKHQSTAQTHSSNSSWTSLSHRYRIAMPFDQLLHQLKNNTQLEAVLLHELWQKHCSPQQSPQELIAQANKFTGNSFEFFGTPYTFEQTIPWHQDFRINSNYFEQFRYTFYQNIIVEPKAQLETEDLPDIKIPWELSRLQHLFILGTAYRQTKSVAYAQAFEQHVNSWIDNNPYLLGINWRCPMEVAIRASNLIWGFHFFKNEPTLSQAFFEKIICSLLEHHEYLAWNWETSDKPNNHYIADLVGYLYLTLFFVNIKNIYQQLSWCIKKLCTQQNHQVQPDGSSYEGSTAYHRLDTEMFLHVQILCEAYNLPLPKKFTTRTAQMIYFLQNVQDQYGNFIHIGDNDSGKFCTGITVAPVQEHQKSLQYFPDFGLSIITHPSLHLTFRHPRFKPHQPSGHFHQDELAFTLSVSGIQLFVDPGSFQYTGNPWWRNRFREQTYHSTFATHSVKSSHSFLQSQDLFQLHRKSSDHKPLMQEKNGEVIVEDFAESCEAQRILHHRQILSNCITREIVITDWITTEKRTPHDSGTWAFVCGPLIKLYQESKSLWILKFNTSEIARLQTSLPLEKKEGYLSPGYAVRTPCAILTATIPVTSDKYQTIISIN